MSLLEIKASKISKIMLLPGDPLRAKYIAENYFSDFFCHCSSHGLLGYTGKYKGIELSVQSTGMGTLSVAECVRELIEIYGCTGLIRIGSCSSSNPSVHVGDVVISTACSNESNCHVPFLGNYDYIPTGSFKLISCAYHIALQKHINVHIGITGCSDILYRDPDYPPLLASEMEGVGFLYESNRHEFVESVLMMTCGAHTLFQKEVKPIQQRSQDEFIPMLEIALELAKMQSEEK